MRAAARLVRQTQGKLAFQLFIKHVGCRAQRGNRGNQRANQLVFDRNAKTGHIFLQHQFAPRGALNQPPPDLASTNLIAHTRSWPVQNSPKPRSEAERRRQSARASGGSPQTET